MHVFVYSRLELVVEVLDFECVLDFVRRVRIPSLAPISLLRLAVPNRDKPPHLQVLFHFASLRSLRQVAPRFNRLPVSREIRV